MATRTKLKKVPKWAWIVGGVAVAGGGYYLYKRSKEQSAGAGVNSTEAGSEGLTNQSFIPVVSSGPGAGAVPQQVVSGEGGNSLELLKFFTEQNDIAKEAAKEAAQQLQQANKENSEAISQANNRTLEAQKTTLEYITNIDRENRDQYLELFRNLTGGGSPGTTPSVEGVTKTGTSNGRTVVGATAAEVSKIIANTPKALFGGRTIVDPNQPGAYIVSAKGQHCPDTAYNRGHPRTMRGCK